MLLYLIGGTIIYLGGNGMTFFYECAGYFFAAYVLALVPLGAFFYFVGRNKKPSTKVLTKVLWIAISLFIALGRTALYVFANA